jgi:ornithine cyclodeaminase/alanine dehydrogenase-like protein (mu-crystallin family)
MTRFLAAPDILDLATHDVVMAAARDAAEADAHGTAVVPPRFDVDLPRGFLRVMPGAFGDLMGVKVMTNSEGVGNRYLLLLYRQADGELLALLDADEVTRLRTAGTTALAASMLQPVPQTELGLIGSGFEATGHLRAMCRAWPLSRVSVYSPSRARREGFADRMSDELSVEVVAVDTSREVCEAADTVLLATKTTQPVLDGLHLRPGAVVLSIGSTRPSLRELDRATLTRTAALLVDHEPSVRVESGDVIDAIEHGALRPEQMVSMGGWLRNGHVSRRDDERDVLTFKSVGTIVQDLALASALLAVADGAGRELGELTRLKPFSSARSAPEGSKAP